MLTTHRFLYTHDKLITTLATLTVHSISSNPGSNAHKLEGVGRFYFVRKEDLK